MRHCGDGGDGSDQKNTKKQKRRGSRSLYAVRLARSGETAGPKPPPELASKKGSGNGAWNPWIGRAIGLQAPITCMLQSLALMRPCQTCAGRGGGMECRCNGLQAQVRDTTAENPCPPYCTHTSLRPHPPHAHATTTTTTTTNGRIQAQALNTTTAENAGTELVLHRREPHESVHPPRRLAAAGRRT